MLEEKGEQWWWSQQLEFGRLWTVKKPWFNVPRDAQPFNRHVDTVTRLVAARSTDPPPLPLLRHFILHNPAVSDYSTPYPGFWIPFLDSDDSSICRPTFLTVFLRFTLIFITRIMDVIDVWWKVSFRFWIRLEDMTLHTQLLLEMCSRKATRVPSTVFIGEKKKNLIN